jgi:hypothetical protein
MSVVMDLTGATSARNEMFNQTSNENDHGNMYVDEYENVTENDFVNMKFRYNVQGFKNMNEMQPLILNNNQSLGNSPK